MIKYEIKNSFTGDVHFVAEIDCVADAQTSRKLGLAVLWALENKADLRWANLSEADLSGANLSEADLSGANLRCADLSESYLGGANLSESYLGGANLSGADLSGADLSGANLSGANLSGADLIWADLSGANLRGADLSGANLSGADLRCADLSGANLRGADFKQVIIYETPIIKRIHQKVAKAVQGGTEHCRAGWVVVLAGAAGEELEERLGTSAAAALIYAASDPDLEAVPNFHCSADEALADILECAEREKSLEAAQ